MQKASGIVLIYSRTVCKKTDVLPTAAFAATGSGSCGTSASWSLANDGTLTISGTGAMTDYDDFLTPWRDYRESITKIVIKSGITKIGYGALQVCSNAEKLYDCFWSVIVSKIRKIICRKKWRNKTCARATPYKKVLPLIVPV